MGASYYHTYIWWELWVDGKVDTSPGMDTSYYHQNDGTPFCMTIPLFFSFFILDMGYPFFFFFFSKHALGMCIYISFFFFILHISSLKYTFRESGHTTFGAFNFVV
jgi:hypothetical protein